MNQGMGKDRVEEAFRTFGGRLTRLAERRMNPLLLRRLSPEDVVQEMLACISSSSSPFLENDELPLYFRLRTALLQTLAQLERRHLGAGKRDAYREMPVDGDDLQNSSMAFGIEAIPDTATSPLSRVARQDRDALLHHALAKLDDSDSAILELRHEECLGNAECAALLGISEKAASMRYIRALKRLKETLEGYSEFRP